MELSQLRYFLEAAKTQHITKSAQRLHIAQPALTQSIRRLESELGVKLFAHRGRNIALTPCGVYLRDRLIPVIKSIDSIPDDINEMLRTENETVRLCVTAASTLVTHAIINYKRLCPEVSFHVLQTRNDELFDIEIETRRMEEGGGCERHGTFLCTEQIYLAVPDGGRYSGRKSVKLAEVKDEGFISLFGSKQLRSICDTFCRSAGFEPNVIFESDSPEAVKNMIGAHMGVGFWPEFTWGELKADNVRLLEIEEPGCRRDIMITRHDIKPGSHHTEAFFKFLTGYFTH